MKYDNSVTLTEEEIARLIEACGSSTTGVRNAAMIMVCYKCALRVSELMKLKEKDLDFEDGKAMIWNSKHGVSDYAILTGSVAPYIEQWKTVKEKLGIQSEYLFCSISRGSLGNKIHPQYFKNLIPKLASKAGITKRVHSHIFRRSAATRLLKNGLVITEIQSHLRHRSIGSTMHYLKISQKQELVHKMNGISW